MGPLTGMRGESQGVLAPQGCGPIMCPEVEVTSRTCMQPCSETQLAPTAHFFPFQTSICIALRNLHMAYLHLLPNFFQKHIGLVQQFASNFSSSIAFGRS